VRNIKNVNKYNKSQLVECAYLNHNKPVVEYITEHPEVEIEIQNQQLTTIVDIPNHPKQKMIASSILQQVDWLSQIKKVLLFGNEEIQVTNSMRRNANVLQHFLTTRLTYHVKTKIHDHQKRKHWCLEDFFKPNVPIMAAIVVLQGHTKMDLTTIGKNDSLLGNQRNFKLCVNDEAHFQGSYLYFDENRQQFVRSGKATGQSFQEQHKQHQAGSKLNTTKSKFYLSYPCETTGVSNKARRGWFQHLTHHVAFGIPPPLWEEVCKPLDRDGIFVISDEILSRIKKMNIQKK